MQPESPTSPQNSESRVWKQVDGTWQPLFGSYAQLGISIEWHDFQLQDDIDWARSFHAGSLEICLNFGGTAKLVDGNAERELPAGFFAAYTCRESELKAVRLAGGLHRFITIELSPDFLRTQCAGRLDVLKEPLQRFAAPSVGHLPFLEIQRLNTALLSLRGALLDPPVPQAARDSWYRAKVLEILSHVIFEDDRAELFCQRHQRQNRERVDRARYLIERDLENPPSLEMLANDVGCSSFHLSRVFADETGMSIPKFLRTRRIERAADLLRSGKANVTEAAMAVGYSSLSAFNKAFVEQVGCCPGLYPNVRIRGRAADGAPQ